MGFPIRDVKGRICFDSRGNQTIEVDVSVDGEVGRAAAPSGASVGIYEAKAFPDGGASGCVLSLKRIAPQLLGIDASDIQGLSGLLRRLDGSENYSNIGGSAAYAVSVAAADAAAKASGKPLFKVLNSNVEAKMPYPLGNVLGGGTHAGMGSPDIQEFLSCPVGARNIIDALQANREVHGEVRRIVEQKYPKFAGGRGDEGAWAPSVGDDEAFEIVSAAVDRVSGRMGFKVSFGIDVAASSLWKSSEAVYSYARSSVVRKPEEQGEYLLDQIRRYGLVYVEDPFHEDAFEDFKKLTEKLNGVYAVGDDLLATNSNRLEVAASSRSGNAAILKVNQAGTLGEALVFAEKARSKGWSLITSHRSGDTADTHIAHVGLATGSVMLKSGVVGGERVAKLNELIRINEELNGLRMIDLR